MSGTRQFETVNRDPVPGIVEKRDLRAGKRAAELIDKAQELVAIHVVSLGSTVLRAYGGREAIDLALQELPDLIVLDLMMPDVDGFDVVEALSEHPDTARIPILVVTAKTITAENRMALNGDVALIIEKTELSHARFSAEVRRAMSGRRLEA